MQNDKQKHVQFVRSVMHLKKRSATDPLAFFCATPPQEKYINDPSPVKLLLGGNQVGKTYATCALLLYHALNRHPVLKTDPPQLNVGWLHIVTSNQEQYRQSCMI